MGGVCRVLLVVKLGIPCVLYQLSVCTQLHTYLFPVVLPSRVLVVPSKVFDTYVCTVPILEGYVSGVGAVVPNPNKSMHGIKAIVDAPLFTVDTIGNTLCGCLRYEGTRRWVVVEDGTNEVGTDWGGGWHDELLKKQVTEMYHKCRGEVKGDVRLAVLTDKRLGVLNVLF